MVQLEKNLKLNKQNIQSIFLYQAIQTSKVISNIFLGICRTPVSPSSPEIQIQGLAVNIEPPSFLLGTINIWYGITANTKNNTSKMKKGNCVISLIEERQGKISHKIILQYHEMLKQHQRRYFNHANACTLSTD